MDDFGRREAYVLITSLIFGKMPVFRGRVNLTGNTTLAPMALIFSIKVGMVVF